MIAYSNAKINIGLFIKDKRSDGYHNLESIFYPIPFSDIIEIMPAEQSNFSNSGIQINPADNLILKAVDLLREHYSFPELAIHIHKQIPLGAGLGGGSSNASFTLKLINELCKLSISNEELKKYALQLGSDCPFFIDNQVALVSGRGEIIKPIDFSLKDHFVKLIYPGIHSSTNEAFGLLKIFSKKSIHLDKNWIDNLSNDFESGIFKKYPELGNIKTKLINEGAIYVSLTGTGSCIYGIFDRPVEKSTSNREWIFRLA